MLHFRVGACYTSTRTLFTYLYTGYTTFKLAFILTVERFYKFKKVIQTTLNINLLSNSAITFKIFSFPSFFFVFCQLDLDHAGGITKIANKYQANPLNLINSDPDLQKLHYTSFNFLNKRNNFTDQVLFMSIGSLSDDDDDDDGNFKKQQVN